MSSFKVVSFVFAAIALMSIVQAKIYDHCEFGREIQTYGVPANQVAIWTCIAQHESDYNTAAVNWSSGDHGIYQISELYWCSTSSTPGGGCNARCADFEDDNIADDTACALHIYAESGFQAWTTWQYCNSDVSSYVAGC